MPADRILTPGEVANVRSAHTRLLCVSHEALREQNTGLGVRVQEAWHRTEQAEEALAAMTSVARRCAAGWVVSRDSWHRWANGFKTDEPITDAERRALDALEETS